METNDTEKKTKEKSIWEEFLTKGIAPGNFNAAMDAANANAVHKKENWSKSPKKTAQVIRNTVSKSATASTVVPPTGKVPQEEEDWTRYILIKGIPIPNDSEDVYPRLTIMTVGGKLYFDDFVYDKDIVIAFEEKSTKFPVPISIGIEFEDVCGLTFTRMGEFPYDSEIKRVVVDLSAPGRSIEGASKKSQRSIKRFMNGISKARKKKAEEERDHNQWTGISATAVSVASGVWSCSAMVLTSSGMPRPNQSGGGSVLSNSHATISLDDDLDLTDAMEESVEELIDKKIESIQELIDQKVKDAVNDLKSDITNGIVEKVQPYDLRMLDGNVDVAKLTASVLSTGEVSKWQAEERVKKLLKGEYDDPGIN